MAENFTIEFEFRNKRFTDAERGIRAFAKTLDDGMYGSGAAITKELKTFLEGVARSLAERHGNPYPSGTGAKTLSKRSGKLIQSILDSVKVTGGTLANIQGQIGSQGVDYAGTHEYGATIRASGGQYIYIPLPAALNANGTPKKRSPREWANTHIGTSKKGNLLVFQTTASGVIPLYVLKSEVKIPARLGMKTTLEAGLPYFVDKAFDAVLKSLIPKS